LVQAQAQKVPNGLVVGIDKYNLKNKTWYQRYHDKIKINFYGNSLHNAIKNTALENVQDTLCFIKSDLIEPMPFIDYSFDVIISSQLLYCIPLQNLNDVLTEINRVAAKMGTIILFEPIKFMNWDIKVVQDFFEKKGYYISIVPLEYLKNKCILFGRKP
jgi:ubiquinone/menaquinone biosynthesis C-methylase UbiE